MKIQKFNQIENIDRLAKIIFFNFIELENEPDIVFNINDIISTLKSNNLLGWFLLDGNGKIIGYIVGELKELTDGRYVYYISYFYLIHKYRSNGLGYKMILATWLCLFLMLVKILLCPFANTYSPNLIESVVKKPVLLLILNLV